MNNGILKEGDGFHDEEKLRSSLKAIITNLEDT